LEAIENQIIGKRSCVLERLGPNWFDGSGGGGGVVLSGCGSICVVTKRCVMDTVKPTRDY